VSTDSPHVFKVQCLLPAAKRTPQLSTPINEHDAKWAMGTHRR